MHFYMTTVVALNHDSAEAIFTTRAYGSIGVIAMYALGGEAMKSMNRDTLSFLFKYPISKLNAAEANQVEMLITTLLIRKPILKASDIFKVETRLFASITGTVVTYVLVALQFHAKLSKH
ncbi:hypothetical protein ILUMI_00888 [Ignelater luminosus]|uniref:Uncharacterized protein n=1 Tax=Ignelater luminosus TaxID=2038154 RepID=A0A8K0GM79_IGNLU|nr:hypothetical protein ILUMI_00888 [Ignelater luminosus]